MKKLLLSLLVLFFITSVALSQEDPKKALSKAGKALTAYNINPTDNDAKLTEAKEMINEAIKSNEIASQSKAWQTKGDIYLAFADKDMAMMSVDKEGTYVPQYIDAPYIAAESLEKALSLAEKKYETKDALKGLNDSARKLNQIGNFQIGKEDYAGAYKTLRKVLDLNKLLVSNGEEAVIAEADMTNHKFVMAFCAKESGETKAAKGLFKELYDAGTNEPTVYAAYFNLLNAEKDPNAIKVLNEGRAKFPENTELLFALINKLIMDQNSDELTVVLEKAIEAEPNNPSVRSALGNVYMNLFTEEYGKNGDSKMAKEYFDKSMDYFQQAVEIDPKQFDAIYSIGSLYFNKAVEIIKVANELPLTKAKEFDAMTNEANGLMEKALPFFQKAESINANDTNTLIALSEIYARMNDFEKSGVFKKRLQNVKDGITNEKSYFNQ